MKMVTAIGTLCIAGAISAGMGGKANAIIVEAHTVGCTNNIFQQCSTANFLAAVGGGPLDVSLNLQADKNGNPLPNGVVAGDSFSNDVSFSSLFSSTFSAGINTTDIHYSAPDPGRSQIGTVDGTATGFRGAIAIDFTNPVSAVGFTTISLETNGTIDLFDINDILIDSFASPSNMVLDYIGLVATGGEEISRIVIDGDFHAVRDIQFNFAAMAPVALPEMGSVALMGIGITGFSLARRRITRR